MESHFFRMLLYLQEVHDYLKTVCPDLHITRGEYDEEPRYPETKTLTIGQFKLGVCHGHQVHFSSFSLHILAYSSEHERIAIFDSSLSKLAHCVAVVHLINPDLNVCGAILLTF